jgi:Major Facilitator Superfamily
VWPVLGAGLAGLGTLGVVEQRRARRQAGERVAPLLRAGLFRTPAFAAGLGVQLAFAAGMQGFFLTFALWLQIGEHFSPLKAGLTAVAFSVGAFITAPVAVPLAQRYGRRILASGAAGMVGGIVGVALAAPHIGVGGNPWPIVPGLVVAGAGLALLVVPLVNVVLAAVPAVPVEVAGGASGLFSTAQQLGGALGCGPARHRVLRLPGHPLVRGRARPHRPVGDGHVRPLRRPLDAAAAHGGVGGSADRVLNPASTRDRGQLPVTGTAADHDSAHGDRLARQHRRVPPWPSQPARARHARPTLFK